MSLLPGVLLCLPLISLLLWSHFLQRNQSLKQNAMYEQLSPSSANFGLYDAISDALREELTFTLNSGNQGSNQIGVPNAHARIHHLVPRETVEDMHAALIERIIIALRNDNERFNELRFRQRLTLGPITMPEHQRC